MPSNYNRAAFRAVVMNENNHVLARAYCALILIELALKDEIGLPNLGHDVPSMLQILGRSHHNCRAALNQQRSDLNNKLSLLRVQTVSNSPGFVRAGAFPDLRYLRHTQDWATDASTDAEIDSLRACVDKIRYFLRHNVGLNQPI